MTAPPQRTLITLLSRCRFAWPTPPEVLRVSNCVPDRWGGLAIGWGLDRLVMVRKKLPDIRLLRDPLPAIAQQMVHLDSWQPVSRHPVARREVSVAAAADQDVEAITGQLLGALFPEEARLVQEVDVLGRWSVAELHPAAVARLGALPGQENLLLRHRGANRAYCT